MCNFNNVHPFLFSIIIFDVYYKRTIFIVVLRLQTYPKIEV